MLFTQFGRRYLSTNVAPKFKVAVIGAGGGIGQPLSLLLKTNPLIKELNLYDIVGTPGVAADISHCDTIAKTKGYMGDKELPAALKGCDVVIIPAGVPRKPGMTRDDLFNINAGIVKNLAKQAAQSCPNAMMLVISNPVNSLAPIVATTLEQYGVYDPRRVCGVTTLDVCRARTFVGEKLGLHPKDVKATVVGGHAGTTILPILSQIPGIEKLSSTVVAELTKRIQFGGDEVVQAKAGKGSATLSMAFAAAKFADSVLNGLNGKENVIECSYVENKVTDARFFALPCVFGKKGVEKVLTYGKLSKTEEANLREMLPTLKAQIQKGIDFAKKSA